MNERAKQAAQSTVNGYYNVGMGVTAAVEAAERTLRGHAPDASDEDVQREARHAVVRTYGRIAAGNRVHATR